MNEATQYSKISYTCIIYMQVLYKQMPLLHYCEKYSLKQGIASCFHAYVNQCLVVTRACLCLSISCVHAHVYQYLAFMPTYINILACLCTSISLPYHCCSFLLPKSAERSHTEAYGYWRSPKQYWVGDNNDCYFTHYSANKRDLFHYSLAWNHHVSRWMFKQSPVTC